MTAVYVVRDHGQATAYATAAEAVAHMAYGATLTREDTEDTK